MMRYATVIAGLDCKHTGQRAKIGAMPGDRAGQITGDSIIMAITTLPPMIFRNGAGISLERALKQAKELVEEFECYVSDDPTVDRIHATIDDLETLLGAVDAGRRMGL